MNENLPLEEIYPKYYQSSDGTEQMKLISRRSYIYTCYYVNGDLYTVRAEHKLNSQYTENAIHRNYKKSDSEEFSEMLKKVTAYFIRIEENLNSIKP